MCLQTFVIIFIFQFACVEAPAAYEGNSPKEEQSGSLSAGAPKIKRMLAKSKGFRPDCDYYMANHFLALSYLVIFSYKHPKLKMDK